MFIGLPIYGCLIYGAFIPRKVFILPALVYVPLRLILSLAYYASDLVETSKGMKVDFDLPLIGSFGLDVGSKTAYNVQAILMLAMEIVNFIPVLAFYSYRQQIVSK